MVKESLGNVWCLSVNSEVTNMLLASDEVGESQRIGNYLPSILKAVQALKSWALNPGQEESVASCLGETRRGKEDLKFLCIILTVLSSKRKKLTVGAKQGDGHALTLEAGRRRVLGMTQPCAW